MTARETAASTVVRLLRQGRDSHRRGDLAAAEDCYRRVLADAPATAEALHLLGLVALQKGDAGKAETMIRQAIDIDDGRADYHTHLGNALQRRGDAAGAEQSYRGALTIDPRFAAALNNLGNVLKARGRLDEAEQCYRRALEAAPESADAYANLGNLLRARRQWRDAAESLRRALEIDPGHFNAANLLGSVLFDLGDPTASERCFRRALALKPDFAMAETNLANLLVVQGRLDEADEAYRHAIAIDPSYEEAHFAWSQLLLLRGDYARGWREFEHRWATKGRGPLRGITKPPWTGDSLAGRTLYLVAERGYGDTLQFIRYLPLVAEKGGEVILAVHPALRRLLGQYDGLARIITFDDPVPPFDVYFPLMSLPRLFSTTVSTIPANVPYLRAAAPDIARWRSRLGGGEGSTVGLVWAGSTGHRNDPARSMPAEKLAPLFGRPGFRFFSLQKEKRAGDEALLAAAPVTDLSADLEDFTETAAVLAALDLLISVDTSVVHLAGALGRPVWAMLASPPDWRWMLDRDDSPWYPSVRLFRQDVAGDWAGVIKQVGAALSDWATGP
jgi:Tfp pilus assembly protein PilF